MTKVSINKNKTKELKMNKAKMKPVEIKVIPGGLKDKDLKHKYSVAIAEGRRVKDPGLKYHRARCVSLKKSNIKEKWLGDEIVKDPSILDLGNVEVVERELAQKRKSLDLLLQNDTDNIRYEVELQLGNADSDHITRSILYWNFEKNRDKEHQHCAVLIVENISEKYLRFLNIIAASIDLIVLKVLRIEFKNINVHSLLFEKILDTRSSQGSSENERHISMQRADRTYWEKGNEQKMNTIDYIHNRIQEIDNFELNYNKYYIGFKINGSAENFVTFRPRKDWLAFKFDMDRDETFEKLSSDGNLKVEYKERSNGTECFYTIRIDNNDLENQTNSIYEVIKYAHSLWIK